MKDKPPHRLPIRLEIIISDNQDKPTKLRGDWSYWKGNIFVKYTWRHRLRLLIGLDGKIQNGQYVFKRVSYGSRLHRTLNYFLSYKPRGRRR